MKQEITVIIALVILVIGLILGMKFASGSFEESDAKKFVAEDLKTKFPNADEVEVLTSETRTNAQGAQYYAIKAKVSSGLDTPCPTRTHYYYNYPEQNFAPSPPEYIVSKCKVCESTPCIIAFEEEAIIASHTLFGTESVHAYVTSGDAVPSVSRYSTGWQVTWVSPSGVKNYSLIVAVAETGTILSISRE